MPQIIVKERTAHLASYAFLQEMLISIKTRHFHNSINHQEYLFHRRLITSYFCPVNIAKFLRTGFLQNTSRNSRLQMFFKIVVLKSFANFTGKHLCWSLFLKNLQAEGLQLHKEKSPTQVFSCEVCEIFKNSCSYRTPPMTASAPPKVASNNFFFSTHRLMDKKSNSFVYKFVVNCQVF